MARVSGKFGKRLPQFPEALKELHGYASVPLPDPPSSVDWQAKVDSWPMDGNNEYGDCTMAAAAHMIQSWDAQTGRNDSVPTDQQVVQEYLTLTKGQDTGLVESHVLRTWQRAGLWDNRVLAYAPVNVHALTTLKQAIALFGGVYAGIQVPANAQQQFADAKPWTLEPGWQGQRIVGGHAIPLLGYDADWLYAITWGAVQPVAWDWWSTYADEAWAIIAQQYKEAGEVNGLDLTALEKDLQLV